MKWRSRPVGASLYEGRAGSLDEFMTLRMSGVRPDPTAADASPEAVSTNSRVGRSMPATVLLVEENQVFALDATDIMRGLGVGTVITASNPSRILAAIACCPPDLVLLTVSLPLGESFGVADQLLGLQIPFCFSAGYEEQRTIPARFGNVAVVRKPYSEESILTALAA